MCQLPIRAGFCLLIVQSNTVQVYYFLLIVEPPDVLILPSEGVPLYVSLEAPLRFTSSLPSRLISPVLAPSSCISTSFTLQSASLTRLAPLARTTEFSAEPDNSTELAPERSSLISAASISPDTRLAPDTVNRVSPVSISSRSSLLAPDRENLFESEEWNPLISASAAEPADFCICSTRH